MTSPHPPSATRSRRAAGRCGYLGGGLLLAINLAVVTLHGSLGLDKALAVRFCLLTAGLWWALLHVSSPTAGSGTGLRSTGSGEPGGLVRQSFGQLATTLRGMRAYPMTLLFLVAYLFFNDGIQTVITAASTYGEKQLGFSTSVLIATILLVQFVAFGGALLFGRLAARWGAHRTILGGLVGWMVIVVTAFALPAHRLRALPRPGGRHRGGPRRHPGALPVRSTASSSRMVGRPSTSASTRPVNGVPAGSARSFSAWCTRSRGRTGPRSIALVAFFGIGIAPVQPGRHGTRHRGGRRTPRRLAEGSDRPSGAE